MPFEKELDELEKKRARALEMGGSEKIKKQHDRGKLNARERIDCLLDPGSFLEVGMFNHTEWHSGTCADPAARPIFW